MTSVFKPGDLVRIRPSPNDLASNLVAEVRAVIQNRVDPACPVCVLRVNAQAFRIFLWRFASHLEKAPS